MQKGRVWAQNLFNVSAASCAAPSKSAANYQEVEIYPMNGTEQSRTLDQELARAADLRRSSKAQQNQNAKNARRLFRQLVNTNFTEEDTHTTQTYAPEYRPETEEQAWADFRNFYRHIKEKCRAQGLPKPECLAVMEWAEENPDTGKRPLPRTSTQFFGAN